MKCPVVSFEVSIGLCDFWPLVFLCSGLCSCFLWWRISLVCLALECVGSWVELGFSVGMEAFG